MSEREREREKEKERKKEREREREERGHRKRLIPIHRFMQYDHKTKAQSLH